MEKQTNIFSLLQNGGKVELVVMSHAFQQVYKSKIKFMTGFTIFRIAVMVRTNKNNNFVFFCQNGVHLKNCVAKIDIYLSFREQKKYIKPKSISINTVGSNHSHMY